MVFDATVGGVMSNAYVTVLAASQFLLGRLYTEPWFGMSGATDAALVDNVTRESALIWATWLLDTQVQWYGTPTTTTQALAWPMTGQVDKFKRPIPVDIVPADIQQATAFYALALLRDDSQAPASGEDATVKRKRIGDLEIEFRDDVQVKAASQGIPAEVRTLLRPYGMMVGSMMVPVLRT